MKITTRTPQLLVISDSAMAVRLIGVFLIIFGSFFVLVRATATGSPGLLGVLLALFGVAIVILPRSSIYTFDRARRTLTIVRRGLRGSTHEEIDFRNITGIELEQPPSRSGAQRSSTYRVALVLRDGSRLPWTSYYTSGPSQHTVAAAAREFLELETTAAEQAREQAMSTAPTPPTIDDGNIGRMHPREAGTFAVRKTVRGHPRLGGAFIALIGLLFLAVGCWMWTTQHERLSSYRPVMARVISSTVTTHSTTRGGIVHTPVVRYSYEVDGRQYQSSTVTMLNESQSGQWASDVAARYTPGHTTTAYYDPRNPGSAFLIHEASSAPYFFIPFSLVFVALGLTSVIRGK